MLNQTTKMFPRTSGSLPVIEGPYKKQPSLLTVVFVIAVIVILLDMFVWRPK